MKRSFFSLTLVMTAAAGLLFAPAASALNAREIMQRVDARDDGDNGTATMEMILLDKKGNERRRTLRTFSKDQDDDRYRLMFFMEPADVRGTGFLTYDYDDPLWTTTSGCTCQPWPRPGVLPRPTSRAVSWALISTTPT